jgi:predicted permease
MAARGSDLNLLGRFRSLIAKVVRRSENAQAMNEELRSHIQHRADDLERSGMTRAEAERRARIEFGGFEKFRAESHEAMGGNFLETLAQDARLSLRVLRKSPGFALAAIATLALAIGANAVVFSVMNALIIRPLNVPHAQSLYGIWRTEVGSAYQSYPDYLDLRDRNRTLTGLAAFNAVTAGMDTGKDPSTAWVYETSGNYFDVLGLQPALGRLFHGSDEHGLNSAPYVVLSYAYWHAHFQDDRSVVGRVVRVNKHPFTIVGVAPEGFHGTLLFFNPDFFVPMAEHGVFGENNLNDRGDRFMFMTLGHVKPGVTVAQATDDLQSIAASLRKSYPKEDGALRLSLARPSLYGDYMGKPVRGFMTGLMLLAGLILLAACANLGGLFAARAADRSREVALRLALGSSRSRILRGLFTEALLLSLAGGTLGLLGSIAVLHGLSAWAPIPRFPIHLEVNPDTNVYLVALLLTLASGFLFGVVPVRQVLRTNPYEVVKAGSVARVGRRVTVRDVLLVVQIAICGVLVMSSMVAMRSLTRSMHANFGFETQNTMLVETDLSMGGYRGDRVPPMQKRILETLEAIPGVERVGLADTVPLEAGEPDSDVFADDGSDLTPSHVAAHPYMFKVSPGYLQAAGTPLLAGRQFTWADDKDAPRVAIVNAEFARMLFASPAKAMGRSFRMPDGLRVQVVGIAEDGKYESLNESPHPAMFFPILQMPSTTTLLVVRSGRDPQQLTAAIRESVRGLDAALPLMIGTRESGLEALLFGPRMATITLGVLGMMGAMLSITGIFGMAAYSVSKRLRELGIRMALGAQRREVLETALGRALKLLGLGSAVGLVLGILASRVLAHIVYQATPRDPLVLGGVVLTMVLLGLVATWIPAQRALSVNPMILLREE